MLDLARGWGEFDVTERTYNMAELTQALDEGRVVEAFGCGTAAVVSPIEAISYQGKNYDVPLDRDNADAVAGKLTQRVWDEITGIQVGKVEGPPGWSVVVK